ncbi:hypothetical protein QC763_0049980 [Podospora pseudopauciseta]|uniref:Uncharacterized protein n=1 Tax=Podospora pseudopauciseta TaxID=2093780 RepID=A0ABR0HFT1_9PEZI|nr:hypothetical protein QC763_0049980 [Podospora pseudopauciseta]
MHFPSVTGLVVAVYGITGVLSATTSLEPFDLDSYEAEGWTCLTPPKRSQPGRGSMSFGNNVCPNQVSTCQAYCSTRGGSVDWRNGCFSNNDGYDSPFEWITYCFICRCKDDKDTTPDLTVYYGSIERYVCERQEQNCYYAYGQYAQSPPEGKCKICPEGEYVSMAPGVSTRPITSLSFATATRGVAPEDAISTTTTTISTSTSAPSTNTLVVTGAGDDLWNALDPERFVEAEETSTTRGAGPQPTALSTDGLDIEVVVKDSGAVKQAAGVGVAVLAAVMAL